MRRGGELWPGGGLRCYLIAPLRRGGGSTRNPMPALLAPVLVRRGNKPQKPQRGNHAAEGGWLQTGDATGHADETVPAGEAFFLTLGTAAGGPSMGVGGRAAVMQERW